MPPPFTPMMPPGCVGGSQVVKGVVESLKVITRVSSLRVAEYAFEYGARARPQEGLRHPQSQHHEETDGLFLQVTHPHQTTALQVHFTAVQEQQ